MKMQNKQKKEKSGFTLLELLVVILIIGILAAIALPKYRLITDKTRFAEILSVSQSLAQSIELYYMVNGNYPYYWKNLDIEIQGCTETGTARYDLQCKNFTVDLNDSRFSAFLGPRNKNLPYNINLNYYFKMGNLFAGRFQCRSSDNRGKNVCKSVCGAEVCYF